MKYFGLQWQSYHSVMNDVFMKGWSGVTLCLMSVHSGILCFWVKIVLERINNLKLCVKITSAMQTLFNLTTSCFFFFFTYIDRPVHNEKLLYDFFFSLSPIICKLSEFCFSQADLILCKLRHISSHLQSHVALWAKCCQHANKLAMTMLAC